MRVRVVQNCKWLGWLGVDGMTVYPFVFLRKSMAVSLKSYVMQHECIHVLQVRRDGWVTFYVSYIVEYFVNLVRYRFSHDAAYFNLSYESEAYAWQHRVTSRELFKVLSSDA